MFWEQSVHYAARSDVGLRRDNNEDNHVVRVQTEEDGFRSHGHLFLVADGMGGHAVGELASQLAVETVPLAFYKSEPDTPDALREAVEEANRVIFERGDANPDFHRMGTTCSSLLLSPRGASVAHVGDSRVYRVRDGRIDQLTFDHSLQWELERRGGGRPTGDFEQQTRNVITRSLGPESTVQVDVEGPFPVAAGDVFVLCSDGLTAHLKDDEIGAIAGALEPAQCCRLLVDLALLRGGSDNVTVVVVRIGPRTSEVAETLPEIPVAPVRHWGEIGGGLLAVLLLVLGTVLAGPGEMGDLGTVLAVLGVAVGVFVVHARIRRRHSFVAEVAPDTAETVVWRPYATASAHLARRFVQGLGTLAEELARTAREEEWAVEWDEETAAAEGAREAFQQRHFATALGEWARSISLLVAGVVDRRKRLHREAKWGKSPTAEP